MPRVTPAAVVGFPSQAALLKAAAAERFVAFTQDRRLLMACELPAPGDADHIVAE
jgi:hypothetical protein